MNKKRVVQKHPPISADLQEVDAFANVVKQVHAMAEESVLENLTATERVAPAIRKRQSKPGALGLPKLLDDRRVEYAIPDEMFSEQACFDRIFVYQVRLHNRNTASDDGSIILTNVGKQRELESAPYGIILSAGFNALDELRSNGVDLGHIVGFIREAPWRKPMAVIEGVEFYIMLLRVGDITGSIDLAKSLKNGDCKIDVREFKSDDGTVTREHLFVDRGGKTWDPTSPFIPADQ